jgi:alpha-mannosidase
MNLSRKNILALVAAIAYLSAIQLPAAQDQASRAAAKPSGAELRSLTAHLIGHAHIDLSWLWRWEETVADIATHTFRGTLAQMDKLPGLTFAQSQAAIYEAVETFYPRLFERIVRKVKDGTWVPVGGMWVEPDLNMPDGESLARQLLYGKRYFLEKFGVDVKVGWNPDSFGHSWQLPQLLKKAGIDSYVFERCAPSPDPTHFFWWEGMDGSRVLGYVPPGWYLVSLKDGVAGILGEASRTSPVKDFMLLYGAGDHGGGPRDSDIEAISAIRADRSQPRLEFVTPEAYFAKLAPLSAAFPVVRRELNFTFPACYTTQAEIKRQNRRSENLLLAAERFSALAVASGFRDYYPERDLDEAWKTVLRNQFHDILDGSSIGPVNDEVLDFSLETIADAIDTRGEGRPLVVFNPLFWERTEPVQAEVVVPPGAEFSQLWSGSVRVIDAAGRDVPVQVLDKRAEGHAMVFQILFVADAVPSFGYKAYRVLPTPEAPAAPSVLRAGADGLENDVLQAVLDPATGWLKSLKDKREGRELLAGPGNVLEVVRDEPKMMSAWELGLKETVGRVGEDGARVEVTERGPVRAVVRVRSPFRHSLFEQELILYAGLPRLDCRVRIDWQERNLMVKAAFPAAVRDAAARFEIPFGSLERPADGTEVPALRWVDVMDGSGAFGLSLLNDSKHGFDVRGNVLRLSVVHGATSPDPEADRGRHELLYSLVPHAGGWKKAETTRRAMELNMPLLVRTPMVHAGRLPAAHSFVRVAPGSVVLTAFKKEQGYAEKGIVLRLVEVFGERTEARLEFPWTVDAVEADLIERPAGAPLGSGTVLTVPLAPYEIKTLKLFIKAG